MQRSSWRLGALALSALVLGAGGLRAAEPSHPRLATFGALEPVNPEVVRTQALVWFNEYVRDPASRLKFEAIWTGPERPLLDRVADTLALDPAAARLLEQARNPRAPAPTSVPPLFQDPRLPVFYRANLALAYAKELTLRRVYEEALAAFQAVNPEDVVDPAAYLFHRGVCEYSLVRPEDARRSLNRLLDEIPEAPERYKTVATLMLLDMLTWKPKDLDWIARKMDNSGRRLQLGRGGPVTQKIQKDIVNRLDEMIKRMEDQQKGTGVCASSNPGGTPGGANAGSPMRDSRVADRQGTGAVQYKRFQQLTQRWGSMPEKERRQVLQDLTRGMSDKHAQAVQNYFRRLADSSRYRSER